MNERLKQLIQQHWQPKPIDPPNPDPNVEDLTGPQRSAEVIRYGVLSLEFWLSPLGQLREWLRLNGKACAVLLIPAVIILPLITWIISQIAGWIITLIGISKHLIILPLLILMAVAALTGTVLLLRAIFGR